MKKQLLIVLTAFFTTAASYAQVPSNDLIANASLINSFPFTDSNLRLDLATASGISPAGCPLGNYPTVYYKFTATNSVPTELIVTIQDNNGANIGTSFAVVYAAPSLNVTDETEFTSLESACAFSASSNVNLVSGTDYYIMVHRESAGAVSSVSFTINEQLPVPTSERDALIALYNSTNGDSWANNSGWNSAAPEGTWYGVDTQNINGVSHVTSINLGGNDLTGSLTAEIGDFPELTYLGLWANQLTGTIPPEIGNLTSLVTLDISPNAFSGSIPTEIGNLVNLEILWLNQNGLTGTIPASFQNLVNLRQLYLIGSVGTDSTNWLSSSYEGDFPDLTALPLELLRMENNFFQFEDIADEFATYQANIPEFVFNPQFTVDPPEEIASPVGEDIVLTLTDVPDTGRATVNRLAPNEYQWFKDGESIPGADEDTYTIVNAQSTDSGVYSCQITNPTVPGFIINRTGITVTVGTLGIDTPSLESLTVYPNPVSDVLTLELPAFIPSKITLFDVSGRLILTQDMASIITQVDLSKVSQGMYVLRLENENNSITRNIIKK